MEKYKSSNLFTFDADITESRTKWTLLFINAFESILLWKRFFPKSQLYQYAVIDILNSLIMPYYSIAPAIQDLETFERIIGLIPKDWIPSGHSTPKDFKSIEAYLVCIMDQLSSSKDPTGSSSRLASLFLAICSLDKASIVSRYK